MVQKMTTTTIYRSWMTTAQVMYRPQRRIQVMQIRLWVKGVQDGNRLDAGLPWLWLHMGL
jgi:hypothetical protein